MATTKQQTFPDFTKVFADFKVPAVDFTGLFTIQRRNVEALSAANQAVAESVQALSRRQAELVQEQVEEILQTAKEVLSSNSPEAGVAKQADFAKKLMSTSFNNFREVAEMASKSNAEVLDVLSERAMKSIEEINDVVKKAA